MDVTFRDDQLVAGVFDVTGNDPVVLTEVWNRNDYHLSADVVAGGTVVDLGANIGAFSVLAAKLGAETVHAYEPHPANRVCLETNVAANGAGGRVVVHGEAVAAKPGKVWLAGTGPAATTVGADGDGLRVEAVGLDEILDAFDEVAFLKLDVEGAEYQIIAAAAAALLGRVRMIALEFHNRDHPRQVARWGAMIAKLAGAGRVEIVGRPMVGGLVYWTRW